MIKNAFIYIFSSLSLFFISGAIIHHFSESGHTFSETYSYAKSLRYTDYNLFIDNLNSDLSFFANLREEFVLPDYEGLSATDSIITTFKFLVHLLSTFLDIIYYGYLLLVDPLSYILSMIVDSFRIGFYFFFG